MKILEIEPEHPSLDTLPNLPLNQSIAPRSTPSIISNNLDKSMSICEVSLQINANTPVKQYFWQDLGPYDYMAKLDSSRDQCIVQVSNWFDKSSKNIDIIIPIFLKGIDNLHKKIIELELVWTLVVKNIKRIILREKNYLSKLKNSNIMNDFKDVHRLDSRSENKGMSKMEEFMSKLLPIIDEHKDEQRRTIESGLYRLNLEILDPLTEKLDLLKQQEFKLSGAIYKKAEECMENVRRKMQKQRDAYVKFRETGDHN
jgi:hypothetical protein